LILSEMPLSAMLEGGHKTNRVRGDHEGKHTRRRGREYQQTSEVGGIGTY
jgi:hypothetical protein